MSSLRLDGVELLVTHGFSPLEWGAYPMVPWAGRLNRGRLRHDGADYQLPVDHEIHAIHGTGYTATWDRADDGSVGLELGDPWPFGGRVTHTATARADRVRFDLVVEATRPMPAQVGWHPWFRREVGVGDNLEVQVAPGRMYEIDDVAIPTGALIAPPDPPWDNCFIDLAMPPRLTWPGFATVELRSSCDHWVIFDHPDHAICVEPQTGPPNALNTDPRSIEPGDPMRVWFELVAD